MYHLQEMPTTTIRTKLNAVSEVFLLLKIAKKNFSNDMVDGR